MRIVNQRPQRWQLLCALFAVSFLGVLFFVHPSYSKVFAQSPSLSKIIRDLIHRSGFEAQEPMTPACAGAAGDLDHDGLRDLDCIQEFIPADPRSVAPPLDPTVPAQFSEANRFLYTGPSPIQRGVEANVIAPYRAAVMRGLVKDPSGAPLPGVLVRVLNHPEWGYTYTRIDGMFDLAVNGGGALVVDYAKTGYLRAQRQADVPWNDWQWVNDTVLVPLDSAVTTVNFNPSASAQIARGSVVTDASGTRQATLLIPAATTAQLLLADGTTRPVSTLSLRATEYTVGPSGRDRMPGPLPATSAYTYAVELSADEAIAQGAQSVQFSTPVSVFFENFLGAPVGSAIPVGSYQFQHAVWMPENNGRVVKIIAIRDGVAELDVTGDGVVDTDQYAALGLGVAQRTQLAGLYAVGAELWQFRVSHLTPWDCNYPGVPGPDDDPPPDEPPTLDEPPGDNPCVGSGPECENGNDEPNRPEPESENNDDENEETECGSVIGCESGALGEAIAVPGTDLSLVYDSRKTPARAPSTSAHIRMRITGARVAAGLREAQVNLYWLGNRQTYLYSTPAANLVASLATSTIDAYARFWSGSTQTTVTTTYRYPLYYPSMPESTTALWARYGDLSRLQFARRAFAEVYEVSRTWLGVVRVIDAHGQRLPGFWDARGQGFGGWTLSGHHVFDSAARRVYDGAGGSRRSTPATAAPVQVMNLTLKNYSDAQTRGTQRIAAAPDASLFAIGDAPDLIVATWGIGGDGLWQYTPDGRRILWAEFCQEAYQNQCLDERTFGYGNQQVMTEVTVDAQGLPWVTNGRRIYRFTAPNQFEVVFDAALQDPPCEVKALKHAEGRLFMGCVNQSALRGWIGSLWPDGQLTKLVGGGTETTDVSSAERLELQWPSLLTVDATGNVYTYDYYAGVIWQIRPNGVVQSIAGLRGVFASSPDGDNARTSSLQGVSALEVMADGRVVFYEAGSQKLREIKADGRLYTLSGPGPMNVTQISAAGQNAMQLSPDFLRLADLTLLPEGSIVQAFESGTIATIVNSAFASFGGLNSDISNYQIPHRSGKAYDIFDRRGRHLETRQVDTNALIRRFIYNDAGYVTGVEDAFSNRVVIERDSQNRPFAIVSADGVRTQLSMSSAGFLNAVETPDGARWQMNYRGDGLLTSFTQPSGASNTFTWSADARLLTNTNALGNRKTLDYVGWRQWGNRANELSGPEGITSSFHYDRDSNGQVSRTVRKRSGFAYSETTQPNGYQERSYSDGTRTVKTLVGDPLFGMSARFWDGETIQMRTGTAALTTTIGRRRSIAPRALNAQLGQLDLNETTTVNGREYHSNYDAVTRIWTRTSPQNRTVSLMLNPQGQPIQVTVPGLAPVNYVYDARGRLHAVATGTGTTQRQTQFRYDTQGYLAGIRDALLRETVFTNDALGRVTRQQLPDGRLINFRYDIQGRIIGLAPPGRAEHGFTYDVLGGLTRYAPPTLSGVSRVDTQYRYTPDRQLQDVNRPDGVVAGFTRGTTTGLVTNMNSPGLVSNYRYDDAGRMVTSSAEGQPSWAGTRAYLGRLVTQDQLLRLNYDDNFWLRSLVLRNTADSADWASTNYTYDYDGLLTQASLAGQNLNLTRNTTNGLLEGTSIQRVQDRWVYNPFAEPELYEAQLDNGSVMFREQMVRDALGRITRKTEVISGVSTITDYTYDLAGRLDTVQRNGVLSADYDYDSNGNRTAARYGAAGASTSFAASYDGQDRIQQYGDTAYTHTANGEVLSKTIATQTTDYTHDVMGNLRRVQLPDGRAVTYAVDGFNRRVAKTVNGTLTQQFVYLNQLEPVAELDGSGNLVSVFMYADKSHVPSLMRRGIGTYRIISDHLGSVRMVIEVSSGTVMQRIDYDEFGRITQDTSPGFQPFGFAGGLYDRDTGLTRFGAREYDPQIGRWMAKDPARFMAGDTNFYSYVGNEPINQIDVDGLQAVTMFARPTPMILRPNPLTQAIRQGLQDQAQAQRPMTPLEKVTQIMESNGIRRPTNLRPETREPWIAPEIKQHPLRNADDLIELIKMVAEAIKNIHGSDAGHIFKQCSDSEDDIDLEVEFQECFAAQNCL